MIKQSNGFGPFSIISAYKVESYKGFKASGALQSFVVVYTLEYAPWGDYTTSTSTLNLRILHNKTHSKQKLFPIFFLCPKKTYHYMQNFQPNQGHVELTSQQVIIASY